MLNPEVLKCHEDLITLETYKYNKEKQWIICFSYVKTYINIFGYLGGAQGGGGFNNQTGPILVHIYPLIYINFIFFTVNLGPYIKSRGTGGTKMSNKGICTTRENN